MRRLSFAALLGIGCLAGAAQANVPAISGGVGESSRALMESEQKNYNVKIVFSGKGGIYLAGVDVMIRDQNGNEVLSGVTDGPILLTELPPGRYSVQAAAEGVSDRRDITVPQSGSRTYQLSLPVVDSDLTYSRRASDAEGRSMSMSRQ